MFVEGARKPLTKLRAIAFCQLEAPRKAFDCLRELIQFLQAVSAFQMRIAKRAVEFQRTIGDC